MEDIEAVIITTTAVGDGDVPQHQVDYSLSDTLSFNGPRAHLKVHTEVPSPTCESRTDNLRLTYWLGLAHANLSNGVFNGGAHIDSGGLTLRALIAFKLVCIAFRPTIRGASHRPRRGVGEKLSRRQARCVPQWTR